MSEPVRSPAAILLIVFNRPAKTRILVDFLLQFDGFELFVAADGWRHAGERARCEAVRATVDELSGRHRVYRRFADRNLGCGTNVATAIQWVLRERQAVIVIEDDVQVTRAFIDHCTDGLARFAGDPRIACLSGGPLVNLDPAAYPALFLSRYPNIWGWATTREAFARYSLTLDGYSIGDIRAVLRRTFPAGATRAYWLLLLLLVRTGRIDTWDFQFYFMAWANDARALTPVRSLTQNIGFDEEATHVKRAPPNVGVLDGAPGPAPPPGTGTVPVSDRYDRLIERELYGIGWRKVVHFAVKYLITRPKSFG